MVEQNLQRLANVSDTNTHAFSESLRMTEAMNIVLQRVMNDVLNGTVRCFGDKPLSETGGDRPVRVGSPSQIDFNSYLREYWLCMLMADFAVWCKRIHKPEVLVEAPTKDEVIEFGGT